MTWLSSIGSSIGALLPYPGLVQIYVWSGVRLQPSQVLLGPKASQLNVFGHQALKLPKDRVGAEKQVLRLCWGLNPL